MESSDDEEIVPQRVTEYSFVDPNETPVLFTSLPIWMEEDKEPEAANSVVFLHATSADGQKVHKQVTSWRLSFEFEQLAILVLVKGGKWTELGKPSDRYEAMFRTIMITLQYIHFLKRSPQASEKSIWDHLHRVFSSFEVRPSEDDLSGHVSLINKFLKRDKKPKDDAKDSCAREQYLSCEGTEDADTDEEEPGLFDSVCSICDNGGEILCCEGRCLRSFHATKDAGVDTQCKSLGYSKAEVEALQNFICRNCLYKQHQCFACGQLGSSDKSTGAQVFQCVSATCGYFYHPKCVGHLFFPENEVEAQTFQKKVASGESFICPVHRCLVCKEGENRENFEMQFAICRRCPRSYHRKCLPRKISFEHSDGIMQRAWDGLLPSRILIYCLKHRIDEDLETPLRNHIIFPENLQKKRKIEEPREMPKHQLSVLKPHYLFKKPAREEQCSRRIGGETNTNQVLKLVERYRSSFPVIDSETEMRMKSLMDEVSLSLNREDILRNRTTPSTHSCLTGHTDKSITLGKVEAAVEAVRAALRKLDLQMQDGDIINNIDDAKTVCEPNVLREMMNWRKKLMVNLAPFIHGKRYTSFGRHFTKVDKLEEIVDKLHWYVQEGDTIVDFCCGANDFSRLMSEKLESCGKKCSYRNYDIIQPKNDFNFEKRDWMTVRPGELPDGSTLIMGLNPPFGVKASLANMFIDKALTFKPKLIILIVPKETKRLDEKAVPYDLIWEDQKKLSGKSFYLPGSVDEDDQQIGQWNVKAPPLSLWSRPDWTAKHKEISLKQCHSIPKLINKEDPRDSSDMSISPGRSECGAVADSHWAPDTGYISTTGHLHSSAGPSMYPEGFGATDMGFPPTYQHAKSFPGVPMYPPSIDQEGFGGHCTGLPRFQSDYSYDPTGFTPGSSGPYPLNMHPQPELYLGPPGFWPGPLPPQPDLSSGRSDFWPGPFPSQPDLSSGFRPGPFPRQPDLFSSQSRFRPSPNPPFHHMGQGGSK